MLQALDRLVEVQGIVKAADSLGVTFRTASNCHESRHVSRKMREALGKYLREQTEQSEEHDAQSATAEPDKLAANEPRGGEGSDLQEPAGDLRREVEALRSELTSLRERLEEVEGRVAQGRESGGNGLDIEDVDPGDDDVRQSVVPALCRVFPELITEQAEPGEEQVYGAAAELVVEWREAWAERKAARYTLDWLRAERRRLDKEIRLIGVFGLTPPPADSPWGERRRERELDWRRGALRRLRWQLPLTWCLHWLLRSFTLGRWGRKSER